MKTHQQTERKVVRPLERKSADPCRRETRAFSLSLKATGDDGTIEGFCHETLPILGVQWHPERQSGARLRADAVDAGPLLLFHRWQVCCRIIRTGRIE